MPQGNIIRNMFRADRCAAQSVPAQTGKPGEKKIRQYFPQIGTDRMDQRR